jgi:hypothetical protein
MFDFLAEAPGFWGYGAPFLAGLLARLVWPKAPVWLHLLLVVVGAAVVAVSWWLVYANEWFGLTGAYAVAPAVVFMVIGGLMPELWGGIVGFAKENKTAVAGLAAVVALGIMFTYGDQGAQNLATWVVFLVIASVVGKSLLGKKK